MDDNTKRENDVLTETPKEESIVLIENVTKTNPPGEVTKANENSKEALNSDGEQMDTTVEDVESKQSDEDTEKSIVISEPTEAMMEEMTEAGTRGDTLKVKSEVMSFWKRGGMHIQNKTRCQDSAFSIGYDENDPLYPKYATNHNKIKVVMDGCGSSEYSLLGVLMFEEEFKKKASEIEISPDNLEDVIREIFQKMLQFGNSVEFILSNYLFTILICFEYEDRFEVCTCGDGFILYVCNGQIFFEELEGTEKNEQGKVLPNYFAYDLGELKGKLSNYKEGTEFSLYTFDKERFSNVGVASDGLRFFSKLSDEERSKLFSMIYYHLPNGLERLLEKYKGIFMDDFSISI